MHLVGQWAFSGAVLFGGAFAYLNYADKDDFIQKITADNREASSRLLSTADTLAKAGTADAVLTLPPLATQLTKSCMKDYGEKQTAETPLVLHAGVLYQGIKDYKTFDAPNMAMCFREKAADIVKPSAATGQFYFNAAQDVAGETLNGALIGGILAYLLPRSKLSEKKKPFLKNIFN